MDEYELEIRNQREAQLAKLYHRNDWANDREAAGDDSGAISHYIKAVDNFEAEYSDILADPKLRQWILDEDERLVRAGDRRPYAVRHRALGEHVRRWRSGAMNIDREAVRAIQMGSEEEAAQALARIRGVEADPEEDLEIARALQMGDEQEADAALKRLQRNPAEMDDQSADYGSAIDAMARARKPKAE